MRKDRPPVWPLVIVAAYGVAWLGYLAWAVWA